MKLIEAMKLIKELQEKASDLRKKVHDFCADLDFEKPVYDDQKGQIAKWIQSHSDVLKKILDLRIQIQKTNLVTEVDIELGGKHVIKSIAEWIHRRRDLAGAELSIWTGITDKNLKEGAHLPATAPGVAPTPVHIRRYYDPLTRDIQIELFRTEPGIIDRTLEVVNATTELLDDRPPSVIQTAP